MSNGASREWFITSSPSPRWPGSRDPSLQTAAVVLHFALPMCCPFVRGRDSPAELASCRMVHESWRGSLKTGQVCTADFPRDGYAAAARRDARISPWFACLGSEKLGGLEHVSLVWTPPRQELRRGVRGSSRGPGTEVSTERAGYGRATEPACPNHGSLEIAVRTFPSPGGPPRRLRPSAGGRGPETRPRFPRVLRKPLPAPPCRT